MTAAVTRFSAHVPGLPDGADIAGWPCGSACPPEAAHRLLGRKGLLAKDRATRLALCATHRALGLPAGTGRRTDGRIDARTAVVVASNLGNVDRVCAVARTVRDHGLREVSPLDAANMSSNVVASAIATWFGFGGPNLMVCSGHPAGLDAIRLAQLLLAAGRADRVVVAGVEPDDPTAVGLLGGRLTLAAACVVLEPAGAGDGRAPTLTAVADGGAAPSGVRLLVGPAGTEPRGVPTVDLTVRLGPTYGALGVLQVAVTAGLLATGRPGPAGIVCGEDGDGWRHAVLAGPGEA